MLKFKKKFQRQRVNYNLKRVTGTLHEDQYTYLIVFRSVLLRIEMFQTQVAEKIKTRTLCSVTFFFNRAGQATDDNMAQAHCKLD